MYRIFPIFLVFLAGISCNRRSTHPSIASASPGDSAYHAAVQDFLRSLNSCKDDTFPPFHSRPFILQDSIARSSFGIAGCLEDNKSFTVLEQAAISLQISQPRFETWSTNLVAGARIVSKDTIDKIFRSTDFKGGWDYFYKQYGGRFYVIGCPIFLRSYTLCVCYVEVECGNLCAEAGLRLYKKSGNQWTEVKDWGKMVS